jgi:pyruvate/2-oxoglutarate dehydrogenase complex dihydrolipoamide acyltransferase (E2) component
LAQEKADYVIMMLGIGDRQEIGEKDLAKEAEAKAKDQQAKDDADKKAGQKPAKPESSAKSDNTEDVGATAQRVRQVAPPNSGAMSGQKSTQGASMRPSRH